MKDLQKQLDSVLDNLMSGDLGKMSNHDINKINANYAKNNYLRFKPEVIRELAKPFTTVQAMREFEGNNQDQIRSAGNLLWKGEFERPEWFVDINIQTKEEVITEAKTYKGYFKDLPWNLQQKLWRHFDDGGELRKTFPNLTWGRNFWSDDMLVEQLSKFKDAAEMRRHSRQMKNLASRINIWGDKFPKAYELYKSMLGGEQKRSKRGNYQQRTPAIEQYDLDGNYIKTFQTWDDALEEGFKRSSIASAIRGTDGHNRYKGFMWKHEGRDFTLWFDLTK